VAVAAPPLEGGKIAWRPGSNSLSAPFGEITRRVKVCALEKMRRCGRETRATQADVMLPPAPGDTSFDRLKALLRKAPGAPLWRFFYHLRNESSRNRALLDLRPPQGLFQPESTTRENRYPAEFKFVRDHLGDGPDRRILSFGCSTGEEVFSLRHYFPTAQIKGVDINRRNIRKCRERLARIGGDPGLSFEIAGSAVTEPTAHYDAVFAMAVFRHGKLGEAPPSCAHLIRFGDFERSVGELARSLKPRGLLILCHANFRFGDTAAASAFTRICVAPSNPKSARTPLYGPDDKLLPYAREDDGVFDKRIVSACPEGP
jgi:SAM-dependent methyltransferase